MIDIQNDENTHGFGSPPERGHEAAFRSDLFLGVMLPRLAACSGVPELRLPGCLPQNRGCGGHGTASTPSRSRKDDRAGPCVALLLPWQVEGVQCGQHQSLREPPWKWKGGARDSRGERRDHFFVCKGSAVTVPSGLWGCLLDEKEILLFLASASLSPFILFLFFSSSLPL